MEFAPHSRFTYQGANAVGAACLPAPEGYGLPLGNTGRWAFGQEVPDPATVRALFPSLSPVDQVDCVTVSAPWLDSGGDGWKAAYGGSVVAFVGSNLMKFGPLLGELLAQDMLSDELLSERIDAKNVAIGRRCRLRGRGVRRRTDYLLCSYQPGMDPIGRR